MFISGEIDLCDEKGTLKNIHSIPAWINALEFLPRKSTFYLVRFQCMN